jgi:hypothetical protein
MSQNIPLSVYSAAMDEIYALRAGCAYEAQVIAATLYMNVPKSARGVLESVQETLLVPAAKGLAYMTVEVGPGRDTARVAVDAAEWEKQHALSHLMTSPTNGSSDVPVEDYHAALDEIAALRTILLRASAYVPAALRWTSFPKSRRSVHEEQQTRMVEASKCGNLYLTKSGRSLSYALSEVAGSHIVTGQSFRKELAARTA